MVDQKLKFVIGQASLKTQLCTVCGAARRGWKQWRRLLKKEGVLPPSSSSGGSLAYHVLCLQWWSLWSRNSWSNLEISRHNGHILGPDNTPCAMPSWDSLFLFCSEIPKLSFVVLTKNITAKMFIVRSGRGE